MPARRSLLVATTFLAGLAAGPSSALDPSRPVTHYMVDYWQERTGLPQKSVTVIRRWPGRFRST